MKSAGHVSKAILMLSVFVAVPAAADEVVAPELSAAAWSGKPVFLEDLKGQVVVICFFDDEKRSSGPAWTRGAHCIKAFYEEAPFALVPVALFKYPSNFKAYSQRLWGKEISCALDTGNAAHKYLGKGFFDIFGIVILGVDGEVLWRGSNPHKGSWYYRNEQRTSLPLYDLEKGLKGRLDKGLLANLDIPVGTKPVVRAVKSGRLAEAQRMLKKLSSSGAIGSFREELLKRLEDLRVEKRAFFDSLEAAGDKWGAYKAGMSYLRCFPKAKDAMEMKTRTRSLGRDRVVKKNLSAQKKFLTVAAIYYGPTRKASQVLQAGAVFAQIATRYSDTEYGGIAAGMIE